MSRRDILNTIQTAIEKKQRTLDFRGNQITVLPPEIGKLTQLTDLILSDNLLTVLPPEIGQLTQLTSLDLSNNHLSVLPPEIGQLTQLTFLGIWDNHLTVLPPEIGQLTQLFSLRLHGNPFSEYPPEIVEQGDKAIWSYMLELYEGFSQHWLSKLMLVGEGGVGKTSLLCALRGEPFTDTSTTQGIDVRSFELPHTQLNKISLTYKAWDFGGQVIYHATHQFFLTNRSLFLLVWNARHGYEQGKLYYWLDAIQARAPESPVIVVATWTDERDADLPTTDLLRKYPQILGFHAVSNKTGHGIVELRQVIAEAAAKLPLMGEKWPNTWLAASEAVQACPEKYITPNDLWKLMQEKNVSKTGMLVLTRWLHELGEILFFRDDNELNDLVILKPQWVTKYISRVLESRDVISKAGIFTYEHMDQLWSDLSPSMRQHFLRLMEKFDLSYRTKEEKEVSLVVERLPLDPPEYSDLWNSIGLGGSTHELSMKFRLNTILPGIPTWFLARSHRFTTHTQWRLGAVFAQENERKHLALVQAFPHDRCVQITVRGPSPHNFFALLKDGLEVTFARYPGLKIERTIPCPGHDDQLPCDYEFNYESLQKAIDRPKPVETVQCQASFESVPVSQLLFGLHWRTQDQVVEKIEELGFKIDKNHEELISLLQREFLKVYQREQAQIESYVPNVFVLRPYLSGSWKKLLIGEKLELQLYCQEPGCWHPTGESGCYVFDYPPKWLRATGKYIQGMVNSLKYVTPFIGPFIGMAASDYAKLIQEDIKLMEELVKILPDIIQVDETSEMKLADHVGVKISELDQNISVEGAPLRAVRLLLEKLDEQQTWGGLKRVLTPENHYLWLCEYHAKTYR